MVNLNKEQKDFILDLFDKVQVKVTDPNAVMVCKIVSEITEEFKKDVE